MQVEIYCVDAFTRKIGSGNRAGVVFDAEHLTDDQMQKIAKFANYSETAFIINRMSSDYDLQVRYFSPTIEVPICGHATIATHFMRAQKQNPGKTEFRVLTGAGVLPVSISGDGADIRVTMRQAAPEFGAILSNLQIHQLVKGLGLNRDDLNENLPVQIVSTGHSKVIVPVIDPKVLQKIRLDRQTLSDLSSEISCNGFFPVAILNKQGELSTQGRMFAPAIGIDEDPVTGNANGPMGAYLYKYGILSVEQEVTYKGNQGIEMGSPGTVYVTLAPIADGEVSVSISGNAVLAEKRNYVD